ncbi:MAG: YegS/Rv2252/BmrU family lipid kinase [Flavitalea sp.]
MKYLSGVRKLVYLINPISGTAKKKSLREMIEARTTAENLPFEILPTDKDGDYAWLAKKMTKEKITDVIICGGDGTVNGVATHLHGIDVNIGIIPMGSGNGLAFTAGIPASPGKALDVIFRGNSSPVDGFYINERFSCMLCGIGFDAQVAHDFAKEKRRGLQTYIRISAMNYFNAKAYPFTIRSKETTFEAEAFFLCIANSNQFGNNFTIAPKASLNDGLVDIVIIKKMSKLTMPFSIISQATGFNALQKLDSKFIKQNIIYFQTSELTVINHKLAPLHIDGDPVETGEKFKIKVVRNAFRLLA